MRAVTPYDRTLAGSTNSLLKDTICSSELINIRRNAKDLVFEADSLVHQKKWDCVLDRTGNYMFLVQASNGRLFVATRVSEDNYDLLVKGTKVNFNTERFKSPASDSKGAEELRLSDMILSQAGRGKSYSGSLIARSFYHYLESRNCSESDLLFCTAEKVASVVKNAGSLKQVIFDIEIYSKNNNHRSYVANVISEWLKHLKAAESHKIIADPLFQNLNKYQQYLRGNNPIDPDPLTDLKDWLSRSAVDLAPVEMRAGQIFKQKVTEFVSCYLKIQNYLDSDRSRRCNPISENDITDLKSAILSLVVKDRLLSGIVELKPHMQQFEVVGDFPFLNDKLKAAVKLCKDHREELKDFDPSMLTI